MLISISFSKIESMFSTLLFKVKSTESLTFSIAELMASVRPNLSSSTGRRLCDMLLTSLSVEDEISEMELSFSIIFCGSPGVLRHSRALFFMTSRFWPIPSCSSEARRLRSRSCVFNRSRVNSS